MTKPERKEPIRIKYSSVLAVLLVLTALSWFVSRELFYFTAGFTALMFVIVLVLLWDDLVIWWSTRK